MPVSATSPDGGAVAFVRNHPNIDPPAQSIWLRTGGSSHRLKQLGGDSDWCNRVVWSADGSTAAFLVQDARLITVDRASRRIVSEKWLTEWKGEYPPYRVVTALSLSADGREARFRECERPRGLGAEAVEPGARLRDCAEGRTDTYSVTRDWRLPG